jgi:Zinc-finger of C2H2 type
MCIVFNLHDKILIIVFISVSIVNLVVTSSSKYSSSSEDTNHSPHARPPLRSAPAPDAAPVTSTRSDSPPAQDAAEDITPRISSASSAPSALVTRKIPIPHLSNWGRQPPQPRFRPTLGIRNRQAVAIEQRHRRQVQRNKRPTTFNFSPCNIKCDSGAAFGDHLRGRKHLNAPLAKQGLPECKDCDREFESDRHYHCHVRGRHHHKVVTSIQKNK